MRVYDSKEWTSFIFRITKSDTVYKLYPYIIFIMIYSAIIAFIEIELLDLSDKAR